MQVTLVSEFLSFSRYLFYIPYRNFNLCFHCMTAGREPTLWRYCEGFPMISRSDGDTFHLVLADRPRPYPAERSVRNTFYHSLCFSYEHELFGGTRASIVLIEARKCGLSLYRQIEDIADSLAAELQNCELLPETSVVEHGFRCSSRISVV